MRTKAQPHNPLGHYQKREPVRQSRWSKNGLDHMFDHSYNHFISGCSAVGSAPALGAGCREFESPHSDQNSVKSFDFAEFFFIFVAKYTQTLPGGKTCFFKGRKSVSDDRLSSAFLAPALRSEQFIGR